MEKEMNIHWKIIILNIIILAGAVYTAYTLQRGYLPFEETIENIREWFHKWWEKR
jgi:hypothetical protein